MQNLKTTIYSLGMILVSGFINAATTPVTAPHQTTNAPVQSQIPDGFTEGQLQASAAAAIAWLNLVDANKYAESWDKASTLTKLTIKKDEWMRVLDATRKPFGSVTSRQVMDQRTAKDPSGLPKGDYIVMFYKTTFSHKTGYELLTLFFEDGQWSVLTYQVDGGQK